MEEIKVTVIMPSLNVVDYIRECMESVINQTLTELEILCIDAGSTDGTEKILKEYAERDNRIQVLHSDKKSYGYQVNVGLKCAKGKYIAILETDDFIKPFMYEELFKIAEENQVDFVKSNYDIICSKNNGEYFRETYKELQLYPEYYNKVLSTEGIIKLYMYNSVLWNAVYRRSFIEKYHIRFHESPGAAYQDTGFNIQILSRAEKIIYIDRSFYQYRIDRMEASTWNPNCLALLQKEISWILESGILRDVAQSHLEAIYSKIVMIFVWGFEKTLYCNNCSLQEQRIFEPYKWFVGILNQWIEEEIIKSEKFSEQEWQKIYEILNNIDDFCGKYKKNSDLREKLLEKLKKKDFIIFGSGIRGNAFLIQCIQKGIEPCALVDNDSSKWGMKIGGIEIQSFESCMKRFEEACYVIANKNHCKDIEKQLSEAGISEEKILFYE